MSPTQQESWNKAIDEAFAPHLKRRETLEQRAAAERRQVGGPDSLVQRIERGEEGRPWWM
jgi:hypothetical protein